LTTQISGIKIKQIIWNNLIRKIISYSRFQNKNLQRMLS
jgi:hypothetical protein